MASKLTIRDRVRRWLGIDALIAQIDALPSVEMFKAMEAAQRKRHGEVLEALNRIELRLQVAHIPQVRDFVPPVLDWDTVQAIALADLEKNPPKEN